MFKIQATTTLSRFRWTILLAISLLIQTVSASAQSHHSASYSTGWLTNPDHPPVQVRFMLTGEVDEHNNQVNALLEVNLEGDWKTYWRSPGEGGVAPKIDWSESENLSALKWLWPTPTYHEQLGVMTLGYTSNVIFPLQLTLKDIAQPLNFTGKLTLPTCTNICVMTDYDLDLAPIILSELSTDANAQHLYQQGLSTAPTQSTELKLISASFSYDSQQLQVQLSHPDEWQSPQILIDGDAVSDDYFSQPSIAIDNSSSDNIVTATYQVSNWLGKTELLNKRISITVSEPLFAHELSALIDDKPLIEKNTNSLFAMILFALLGGLILNIMPCVLPVLGMKLNSMLASSTATKGNIRLQFLASAAGILTSFWLLATGLLILKFTGSAIGWGIQFQSPIFIGFMVTITALFTANLLGLFELRLPSRFSTTIASKGNNSIAGHFIQGMFATLLATPCSAPFLGTAVAFALGASVFEMWAVFTFLGLGMALPWLLFALFPSLVSLMPKPGAWMNKVKVFFGLMMLVTTMWLLSLLTAFIGGLTTVLIALLLLTFLLYKIGKNQGKKTVIVILSITLITASTGLLIGSLTAKHWATPIQDNLDWQPLNQHSIDEYVQQGKTVFVDVTADWCITCKANKIGVILQDPVYSALQNEHVVVMKGDWTHPSDTVTNYLRSHQRFGVPLNVVYGPNAPSGLPLPVLLNSKKVLQALQSAKGSNHED